MQWIWSSLLLSIACALPLDVTTDIADRRIAVVLRGEVQKLWNPDFASSTPCHPVPQFIERDFFDSRTFELNNTGESAVTVEVEVTAKELSPSLSVNSLVLQPFESKNLSLTYSCNDLTKGSHTIIISLTVQNVSLTIVFLKVCSEVPESRFDYSMIVLLALAVSVVTLSSMASIRPGPSQEMDEANTRLESKHIIGFIVFGSVALILLFFLGKYLVYVLTVFVSLSSFTALLYLFEFTFSKFPKSIRCEGESELPVLGKQTHESIIGGIISIALLIWYLFTKYWLLNNLIGCSFVFLFLKIIKLDNFRNGAFLLALAFFYDIFWVFYSEPIFGGNVMVTVATSIDLPIKLECVHFRHLLIPDQCGMIGLGDLVLPGLVIAFACKYDSLTKRNYYFPCALLAYVSALVGCGVGLVISEQAQPALLYISPCLIIMMGIAGAAKGDLSEFWTGNTDRRLITAVDPRLTEMRYVEDR